MKKSDFNFGKFFFDHPLESKNLINRYQSGFRAHRSTRDNLLFLTQKISETFARKRNVCSIFFDISKAFDKVWHLGLLYKMYIMEIPEYLIRIPSESQFYIFPWFACKSIRSQLSSSERLVSNLTGASAPVLLTILLLLLLLNGLNVSYLGRPLK